MAGLTKAEQQELQQLESRAMANSSSTGLTSEEEQELAQLEARFSATSNNRPIAAAIESAGEMATAGYAPNIKAAIVEGLTLKGKSPKFDFAQGMSGNFAPSRAKALATLDRPISEVISGKAYENLPELNSYVETRDYAAGKAAQLKEANPKAALAGMIGGALLPIGAATTSLRGLKGVKLAKGLLKAGAKGGAIAALSNPGDVEGEITPLQPKERIQQGLVGGGLSMLLPSLGLAARKLAPAANKGSQRLATRSLGRGTQAIKDELGDKALQQLGKTARKEKIIGAIPRGIRKINERVVALKDRAGEIIGNTIDEVDNLEQAARKEGFSTGISKSAIVDKLKNELADPDLAPDPEDVKKIVRRLDAFLERGGSEDLVPTKIIHTIKSKLGQKMKKDHVWKRLHSPLGVATDDDRFRAALYDALNDSIQDSSGLLAKRAGKSDLASKIKNANKLYSQAKNMETLTRKEVARSNTNNLFGLISTIVGTATGVNSSSNIDAIRLIKGLGAAAGVEAAKRGGPQLGSKLLQKTSGALYGASKIPVNTKAVGLLSAEAVKKINEENAIKRRLEGK